MVRARRRGDPRPPAGGDAAAVVAVGAEEQGRLGLLAMGTPGLDGMVAAAAAAVAGAAAVAAVAAAAVGSARLFICKVILLFMIAGKEPIRA